MDFQTFFEQGMKRPLPQLLPAEGELRLNLGAGNAKIDGYVPLDLPNWNAEREDIPCANSTVDAIIAFHFLEHLTGERAIYMLRECERVLVTGGTMLVVVPHRLGAMAYDDLDHKSYWNESTWKTLFNNDYYEKNHGRWRLRVHFNLIAGVVERNLAVFTQLVKE